MMCRKCGMEVNDVLLDERGICFVCLGGLQYNLKETRETDSSRNDLSIIVDMWERKTTI